MGKNQLKFLPILPRIPFGDATQFVVLSPYDKLMGLDRATRNMNVRFCKESEEC